MHIYIYIYIYIYIIHNMDTYRVASAGLPRQPRGDVVVEELLLRLQALDVPRLQHEPAAGFVSRNIPKS